MSIEVVFEKRINNARVCRGVDAGQRKQIFLLTALSAIFVLALLIYGYQQYRWLRLGYDIEKLKEQKEAILDYHALLILERETVGRSELIDSIARNQLGMVVAAPGQIVSVHGDEPWTSTPEEAAVALTASKE